MPILNKYLERVSFQNKEFIGTIAFKSEEITLPDGSKMALGIDDGIWLLICQKPAEPHIKVFKYDQQEQKIIVDQKASGEKDIIEFKKLLKYFFSNARVEDLVTILPPQV